MDVELPGLSRTSKVGDLSVDQLVDIIARVVREMQAPSQANPEDIAAAISKVKQLVESGDPRILEAQRQLIEQFQPVRTSTASLHEPAPPCPFSRIRSVRIIPLDS